jgi:hypothetical protein
MKYIRVSTILSKMYPFDKEGFERWCKYSGNDPDYIRDESLRVGNMIHDWIENSFYGIGEWADGVIDNEKDSSYYSAVQRFLDAYEVVESENRVYCDKWKYTGRYDAIVCDETGSEYLVDIKSFSGWRDVGYSYDFQKSSCKGKVRKARTQLSMYKNAKGWDGDMAVVAFVPGGEWRFIEVDYTDKWEKWLIENQDTIEELFNVLPVGEGVLHGKKKEKADQVKLKKQTVRQDSWKWVLGTGCEKASRE